MSVLDRNLALLASGRDLLRGLPAGIYGRPAPALSLSAAGVHVRHALEFYHGLLAGLGDGRIDYDARHRTPALEADVDAALAAFDEVIDALRSLDPARFEDPLWVRQDDVAGEAWSGSSLRRELQFVAAHLVHHYALVGVILRGHGVEVPSEFGVAPSTLDHWREARAR